MRSCRVLSRSRVRCDTHDARAGPMVKSESRAAGSSERNSQGSERRERGPGSGSFWVTFTASAIRVQER